MKLNSHLQDENRGSASSVERLGTIGLMVLAAVELLVPSAVSAYVDLHLLLGIGVIVIAARTILTLKRQ